MNKLCKVCKTVKGIDEFHKRGRCRSPFCKSCSTLIRTKKGKIGFSNMPEEEWRYVYGSNNRYSVSNFGRVKSNDYHDTLGRLVAGKLLHGSPDGKSYLMLYLRMLNKKPTLYKIHRLVLSAFIENKKNLPQINHINGDKQDNRLCNLEWISAKDNMHHARANGMDKQFGETHNSAKLKNQDVIEIFLSDNKTKVLMNKFNVSRDTILCIKSSKTWRHLTQKLK